MLVIQIQSLTHAIADRDDDKHNGVDFVEISNIFAVQDEFIWNTTIKQSLRVLD